MCTHTFTHTHTHRHKHIHTKTHTTLQFNSIISDKINVVLVYRPLNSSSSDSVALIDYLQRQSCSELQLIPLILLGDFNLSKVDWGHFTLLPWHSPPILIYCN